MIAALYTEGSDGVLREINYAGYERVIDVEGRFTFTAEEDWGPVTHIMCGEANEELPPVIRPFSKLKAPVKLRALDSVTLDMRGIWDSKETVDVSGLSGFPAKPTKGFGMWKDS